MTETITVLKYFFKFLKVSKPMKKHATFGQVWLLIVHCPYNLKDYEYCLSVDLMPNYVLCRYDANETDVFQS